MIKNNNHDAYTKAVPGIIRDVVLDGSHVLTEEEAVYFTDDAFFADYDTFMEVANLPPLALEVEINKYKQKTISLNKTCLGRMSTMELEEYRAAFAERFDDAVDGQQVGQNVEVQATKKQEPQRYEAKDEFPAARQKNADYAAASVLLLFDDPLSEYPDDYGIIENRQALFFETMDRVCDCYALPRLPIRFDEYGVPYFAACEKQVADVKELYHQRQKTLNDLAASFKETSRTKEEFDLAIGFGFSALRSTWSGVDNKKYNFKGQVLRYSESFIRNGHDMVAANGGHLITTAEQAIDGTPSKKFDFPAPIYN